MTQHRVVIVGGGHAGCSCAKSLRQENFTGEIVLISNESELPYHRPPLSKSFIKDAELMDYQKLYLQPESFYEKYNIKLRMHSLVSEIDTELKAVKLYHGETFHYDDLVLATGTRARPLPLPGVELDGVMNLRTATDARKIRDHLKRSQNVVIVGGGFIGMELASTARHLGKHVTVLENMPRILGRSVSPIISDYITQIHRLNGINIEVNTYISELRGERGHVTTVVSDRGEIPADLVLIGVGAIPNSALAEQAGILCENGIVVDDFMRTSAEHVYAIGDCANHKNPYAGNRRIRLESVQNANDQAFIVAKDITEQSTPYLVVPWFWTDQGDVRLQMTGLSYDTNDYVLRGDIESGHFSVFHYANDRLVAVDSVNQPQDHMMARKLLGAGISPEKSKISDTQTHLKSFLL